MPGWPGEDRDGTGITLRDRARESSLGVHACLLCVTVFVGIDHPNMEETGILEKIPSHRASVTWT